MRCAYTGTSHSPQQVSQRADVVEVPMRQQNRLRRRADAIEFRSGTTDRLGRRKESRIDEHPFATPALADEKDIHDRQLQAEDVGRETDDPQIAGPPMKNVLSSRLDRSDHAFSISPVGCAATLMTRGMPNEKLKIASRHAPRTVEVASSMPFPPQLSPRRAGRRPRECLERVHRISQRTKKARPGRPGF